MKTKRLKAAFHLAIVIVVTMALSSGCFLPVPGFRDNPNNNNPTNGAPDNNNSNWRNKSDKGVYHTIQQDETVSLLAELYSIPQDDIIGANRLKDPSKVQVGQVLFIPGATRVIHVSRTDPPPDPPDLPNGNDPPPLFPDNPPPDRTNTSKCPPGSIKFAWPADGKLTSMFGMRKGRHHDGVDVFNKIGTPILAAADGVVIYSSRLGGYGLVVIIKHEGSFKTVYAHNRKNVVKKGATVTQGQKIAELGASGNATGPHLHFEIRCGQDAVDPALYLPKL